jgi:hypothetical protein
MGRVSVEPEFYQQARSPLIVNARVLPHDHGPAALLLDDVPAPRLSDLPLTESSCVSLVDGIIGQIAQITGNLPALADIRTPDRWQAQGQIIVDDLHALVRDGHVQHINHALIDHVRIFIDSSAVLEAIAGPGGYLHQDLCGENVLIVEDGYRVLDWQRPIWGPVALDRATLLESIGLDPAQYVSDGVIQLRRLLLIGWLAQAARYWFPAGVAHYDHEIATLIGRLTAA